VLRLGAAWPRLLHLSKMSCEKLVKCGKANQQIKLTNVVADILTKRRPPQPAIVMTMATDLVGTIMTMIMIIQGIFIPMTIPGTVSVGMIILTVDTVTPDMDTVTPLFMLITIAIAIATATEIVVMTTVLLDTDTDTGSDRVTLTSIQVMRTVDTTMEMALLQLRASSSMTSSHQRRWKLPMPQKGLSHRYLTS
jgi:hypothetical protein